MLYQLKSKSHVLLIVLFMIITQACIRPLFVTHWTGKDKALLKKKGWGWPNHQLMANVVCTNKMCLDKAERTSIRKRMRFKGFRTPHNQFPTNKKVEIFPDSTQINEEEIDFNQVVVFNHVQFETNSSKLLESSFDELNSLVRALANRKNYKIHIVGYTDSMGENAHNQHLSFLRAQEVAQYLIRNGVISDRISYKGSGEDFPIANNDNENGRAMNRRVEYLISK